MRIRKFPGLCCPVLYDKGNVPDRIGEIGVKLKGVAAPEPLSDKDVLRNGQFLTGDNGSCWCVVCLKLGVGCDCRSGKEGYAAEKKCESHDARFRIIPAPL